MPVTQDQLDVSSLAVGNQIVELRVVKRIDTSLPFACMAAVSDAQVIALYNVMVRLVDDDGQARITRLMLVREKLITAKVSKFFGLIGTYAGK